MFLLFTSFPYNLFIGAWLGQPDIPDSINFGLGFEEEVLDVIADAFSDGNGECDRADLGWTVLCSGCLLSVLCLLNAISSLCELKQPWGCHRWNRKLQNSKQLASLVGLTL